MKASEFKHVGTFKFRDKYVSVREYMHGDWFRIKGCNINAKTFDEAVEKFKKCQEKRKPEGN